MSYHPIVVVMHTLVIDIVQDNADNDNNNTITMITLAMRRTMTEQIRPPRILPCLRISAMQPPLPPATVNIIVINFFREFFLRISAMQPTLPPATVNAVFTFGKVSITFLLN